MKVLMLLPFLLFILITVLNLIDLHLYTKVILKLGPQYNYWPFSGIYVYLKNRKKL
jgi:hypothetical protein